MPRRIRSARPTVVALALTGTLAAAQGVPAQAATAKRLSLGKHRVCVKSGYFTRRAGSGPIGPIYRDEHVRVRRLSRSGKYAYAFVYGGENRYGWVRAADLCRARS